MDISVALLMDQLSVDDWPLSMADGSAVKLLIVALATVGAVAVSCGGGGGGGGGTFFLQPGATTAIVNTSSAAAILEACNLSVALILNNLLFFKSTEFLYSKQALYYCLVS
jgi:hypothetical protein